MASAFFDVDSFPQGSEYSMVLYANPKPVLQVLVQAKQVLSTGYMYPSGWHSEGSVARLPGLARSMCKFCAHVRKTCREVGPSGFSGICLLPVVTVWHLTTSFRSARLQCNAVCWQHPAQRGCLGPKA